MDRDGHMTISTGPSRGKTPSYITIFKETSVTMGQQMLTFAYTCGLSISCFKVFTRKYYVCMQFKQKYQVFARDTVVFLDNITIQAAEANC
jgi:hypothetical protein